MNDLFVLKHVLVGTVSMHSLASEASEKNMAFFDQNHEKME